MLPLSLSYRTIYCISPLYSALWMNIPGLMVIVGLCILAGLVMYAVYENCDLRKNGQIRSNDQVSKIHAWKSLVSCVGVSTLPKNNWIEYEIISLWDFLCFTFKYWLILLSNLIRNFFASNLFLDSCIFSGE